MWYSEWFGQWFEDWYGDVESEEPDEEEPAPIVYYRPLGPKASKPSELRLKLIKREDEEILAVIDAFLQCQR